MADADYIIVGGGINALVAAAMLGKKGNRVLVLEREAAAGGCLRTEAITAPGFIHDVMATTFVLFTTSPAYAAIGADLARHGLEFCNTRNPTAVVLPDGRHLVLSTDRAGNIAAFTAANPADGEAFQQEMDRFGADAGFVFGLLGGRLWSLDMLKTVAREAWKRGLRGLAAFFGEALIPARPYLETRYRSDLVQGLFAPWVLHCGLNPESTYSGEMVKVIGFALEAAGAPIVRGGAINAVRAFEGLIAEQGGTVRTDAEVISVTVDGANTARGVRLADGGTLTAAKGVICSVAPSQLYGKLLAGQPVPEAVTEGVARYRYGKGDMQIHYALREKPKWKGAGLDDVALIHLTPGLDGVSRAANEAERGLLPAVPTICVGQPTALDPGRAPEGQAILWLQLPEAPRRIKGDAAGEIATESDGRWTDAIRERFADRVEAILRRHIENFDSAVIARKSYSPADLEALNVNLVGGDPYGGYCGIDQFFIWRPLGTTINHATHVRSLYHIGAATHPGPGLGGGSGYLLGKALD
ncbi:phytoene dehydrogenase-like protein [Pseudochelatococcus lubricantis]|uniref:Phytoene dehydrogenase-like protein n=1 Tax=Pseudochelatococcus lubricantis TaxID=1538102 RepID=A0ABX0V193_9HYPH|nr:NAD(P)/FAD-dependent oxidoreductase [Pseudochelatococcus lubricantis]NIJ58898.1 phytoene dehydrogenase-like protein [Pseudochelatococcus lubricantis]